MIACARGLELLGALVVMAFTALAAFALACTAADAWRRHRDRVSARRVRVMRDSYERTTRVLDDRDAVDELAARRCARARAHHPTNRGAS